MQLYLDDMFFKQKKKFTNKYKWRKKEGSSVEKEKWGPEEERELGEWGPKRKTDMIGTWSYWGKNGRPEEESE